MGSWKVAVKGKKFIILLKDRLAPPINSMGASPFLSCQVLNTDQIN